MGTSCVNAVSANSEIIYILFLVHVLMKVALCNSYHLCGANGVGNGSGVRPTSCLTEPDLFNEITAAAVRSHHPPTTSTQVEKECSMTSTPPTLLCKILPTHNNSFFMQLKKTAS
jgi:hypothetical protein